MIRTLSQSLVAVLCWQTALMPVAFANEKAKAGKPARKVAFASGKAELSNALKTEADAAIADGFQFQSSDGGTVTAEALSTNGAEEFEIVAPAKGGGPSAHFHVSGKVEAKQLKTTIVVKSVSGATIATQSITINKSDSDEEIKEKVNESIDSMASSLKKHASTPLLDQLISSAHADEDKYDAVRRTLRFVHWSAWAVMIMQLFSALPEGYNTNSVFWSAFAVHWVAWYGYSYAFKEEKKSGK